VRKVEVGLQVRRDGKDRGPGGQGRSALAQSAGRAEGRGARCACAAAWRGAVRANVSEVCSGQFPTGACGSTRAHASGSRACSNSGRWALQAVDRLWECSSVTRSCCTSQVVCTVSERTGAEQARAARCADSARHGGHR